MATATITLPGENSVEVTVGPDSTVIGALQDAAAVLGVDANFGRMATVKNGEDVRPDAPVNEGDKVAAAPRVNNG